MNNGARIRQLVRAIIEASPSLVQAERTAGISGKTLLKYRDDYPDDKLAKIDQSRIDALIAAARQLDVDVPPIAEVSPLWDFHKTFRDNVNAAVRFPPTPAEPFKNLRRTGLGMKLRSPFGASASVLTSTPQHVAFLYRSGANVVTLKTVRSRAYTGYGVPNAYFAKAPVPYIDPANATCEAVQVELPQRPSDADNGMLNCFAMPSLSPELWQADVRSALAQAGDGQKAIVSVVGTAPVESPSEDLVRDFGVVSRMAVAAGATAIELNLSCPNCDGLEGSAFQNPDVAAQICSAVRRVVGKEILLLAKIGFLSDEGPFFDATAEHLDGIAAINTLPVDAWRPGPGGQQVPAFAHDGRGGLSGRPIVRLALDMIRRLARRAQNVDKDFSILGMGGITEPADVRRFLSEGAQIVQSTTAFFVDPLFGYRVHKYLENLLEFQTAKLDDDLDLGVRNWGHAIQELGLLGRRDPLCVAHEVREEWVMNYRREYEEEPTRAGVPSVARFKGMIQARARYQ